ncbi:MAG: hypothetical protein ABI333_27660 [bacterium]
MRRSIVTVTGLVVVFGLSAILSGCSSKPSCKLLYQRYKECEKMPLTEEAFTSLCDKMKDKARTKEEIKCSAKSDCDAFKKCLKAARKKGRAERMKKRWKEAMEKAAQGDYGRAMSFCEIWKEDMGKEFKEKCKGLPEKAADQLMKQIAAKRDAGKVSYKEIKCWDLKRYAKKAGPAKLEAAKKLCDEVEMARDVQKAKEAVAKQLKKPSPYLPFYCSERQLDKYRKIGSPYAQQQLKLLVEQCYRTLGMDILTKKLPKQKYSCWVQDVYNGIKKYQIKGAEIDKLMEKAAEKCEKKK